MTETQIADQGETPIRQAIRRAGEWFLANQNDRFIHYRYDPYAKAWPEARHAARELASLWAIAKLARFLDDDRFTALAERGFGCYVPSIQVEPNRNLAVVGPTPRRVKLNYTAFMILSLLESDLPEGDEILGQLGRGVAAFQQRDGRLRSFLDGDEEAGQDFYPGQAMLALMSLYERLGDAAFLRVVQHAFPYYRAYWRKAPNRPFVPWQTQALCKLYRATGNPDVADFVFEMNDQLAGYLADTGPDDPRRFNFDSGIVIAVFIEGLNQAFALARDFGDRLRAMRYATLVRAGTEAVLALECPMEGQDPADFDPPAIGGFFARPDQPEMRVDHNQHALMALMGACEVGLLR